MQKGVLKVKIKASGHRKKAEIIANKGKFTIPKEFILDNELNNKECDFEVNENNKVIKIIIEGKEIEKKEIKRPKRVKKCKNREYLIPNDTCLYLGSEQVDNLNLRINKFVSNDFDDDKDKYELRIDKLNISFKNQIKEINFYYNTLESFIKDKIKSEFSLKIENRLIIGLGSTSVYETSITLHHIYGVPYIPASAIKGSLRSCIIRRYFNGKEEKALKRDWFITIFGSQEQEGKVIFFDSFSKDVKIQKDIMTPHYSDYYDKKQPPSDTQSPNPIPFLTVIGEFVFFVAVKEDIELKVKSKKFNLLAFVGESLKKSLQEFGIGAKTSVGYGYFKDKR